MTADETVADTVYDAVVIGSGVLGLSIATELNRRGVKVAVVARDLPEDVYSSAFASPWAGANWSSFELSAETAKYDIVTFNAFAQLSKDFPDLIMTVPYVYYSSLEDVFPDLWYKGLVFNYRHLDQSELVPGTKSGVTFTSYVLNPPNYIGHLAKTLRAAGVPIIRQRLSSLDEAYCIAAVGPVKLVINATGLGSQTLLGVEDAAVHPVRGQTVLVKAPDVRTCKSLKRGSAPNQPTYIISRPGPDGHVILGGTTLADNYSTLPDPKTAERILRSAYAICPELSMGQGWEKIEIVSHNVGLRPARHGGVRVELERRVVGKGLEGREGLLSPPARAALGKNVAVVHAYGIGSAGYQTSIGIAMEASDLCEQYLTAAS